MKYLKDILAEKAPHMIDFEFVSRTDLITKKKKDGGTYDVYEYNFLNSAVLHTENIFPKTHDKVLTWAVKGDICRAELDGTYVNWSILPRGEAVLDLPHPTPTQAKKAGQAIQEMDLAGRTRDISIVLQAFTKSWIEGGVAQTPEQADSLARAQFVLHQKSVYHFLFNS